MPITPEQFRTLRDSYACRSSWAIWRIPENLDRLKSHEGIDDLSIFDDDNIPLDQLHPEYVFVGLNCANDVARRVPFSMFHSELPDAQDYKLRHALFHTLFWGGYLTDVFNMINRNGGAVVSGFRRELRESTIRAESWIESFRNELNDVEQILGRKPLLIAMGGDVVDVFRLAKEHQLLDNFLDDYSIGHIAHYSSSISYENYRREIQCLDFWTHFRAWCNRLENDDGNRDAYEKMYHPATILVAFDRLQLRFTVGDENGVPWVATEIYCREGQEQRDRIAQYRAQFDAAFGANAPGQDWNPPLPRPNTRARVVRFIRRADWQNPNDALFAQMAADYEAIRKTLNNIGGFGPQT